MSDLNNSAPRILADALFVAGTVLLTVSEPSLSQLSGNTLADQPDVTIVDNGTGDFTITVQNFMGPNGYAIGIGTPTTISNMVSCTAQTYSGNAASFTFKVEDDASTATDAGFNFLLLAV